MQEVPLGFAVALSSVMSQRLLFNIRHRYTPTTLAGALDGVDPWYATPEWPSESDADADEGADPPAASFEMSVSSRSEGKERSAAAGAGPSCVPQCGWTGAVLGCPEVAQV